LVGKLPYLKNLATPGSAVIFPEPPKMPLRLVRDLSSIERHSSRQAHLTDRQVYDLLVCRQLAEDTHRCRWLDDWLGHRQSWKVHSYSACGLAEIRRNETTRN